MENNNWISVNDRLPDLVKNNNKASENVLVFINTEARLVYQDDAKQIAYYTIDGWCYGWGDLMYEDDILNLNYWQSLPENPKM